MLLEELPLHTSQGPDCLTVVTSVTRQLRMHLRFSEKHFFCCSFFNKDLFTGMDAWEVRRGPSNTSLECPRQKQVGPHKLLGLTRGLRLQLSQRDSQWLCTIAGVGSAPVLATLHRRQRQATWLST